MYNPSAEYSSPNQPMLGTAHAIQVTPAASSDEFPVQNFLWIQQYTWHRNPESIMDPPVSSNMAGWKWTIEIRDFPS